MKPHEQRVVEEKRELDNKIEKLIAFIQATGERSVFELLPEEEQSRLRIQLSVMETYGTVLGERIAHFESPNP